MSYAGIGANFHPVSATSAPRNRFERKYHLPKRFILTVARVLHGAQKHIREYPGRQQRKIDTRIPALPRRGWRSAAGRSRQSRRRISQGAIILRCGPRGRTRSWASFRISDCISPTSRLSVLYLPHSAKASAFRSWKHSHAAVPQSCPILVLAPEIAGGAAFLIDPRDEVDIANAFAEVTRSQPLRRRLRELGIHRARTST